MSGFVDGVMLVLFVLFMLYIITGYHKQKHKERDGNS